MIEKWEEKYNSYFSDKESKDTATVNNLKDMLI